MPGLKLQQGRWLVLMATSVLGTSAVLAAAAEVHNAQGEMAGEVTATTVLLQSRLTALPGPDLDATGDIPGGRVLVEG